MGPGILVILKLYILILTLKITAIQHFHLHLHRKSLKMRKSFVNVTKIKQSKNKKLGGAIFASPEQLNVLLKLFSPQIYLHFTQTHIHSVIC